MYKTYLVTIILDCFDYRDNKNIYFCNTLIYKLFLYKKINVNNATSQCHRVYIILFYDLDIYIQSYCILIAIIILIPIQLHFSSYKSLQYLYLLIKLRLFPPLSLFFFCVVGLWIEYSPISHTVSSGSSSGKGWSSSQTGFYRNGERMVRHGSSHLQLMALVDSHGNIPTVGFI